jgi:hypothetical protein
MTLVLVAFGYCFEVGRFATSDGAYGEVLLWEVEANDYIWVRRLTVRVPADFKAFSVF